MKLVNVFLLVMVTLLVGLILGAYLQDLSTKKNDVQVESYDAVMFKLPKKGCSLELLRKKILFNKAQGMILEGLYQDELKNESKRKK